MAERDTPPRSGRGIAGGVAGTWPPSGAAQPVRGLTPPGFAAWAPHIARLREWARAEAGAGRLLPWVAVAFGIGIALYFTASHEPVLSVAVTAAATGAVAAFAMRRSAFFATSLMVAAIAAGFTGLLSLFNVGGRFFWASLSDYIGRKNTYYTFFLLGIALYAAAPWFAQIGIVHRRGPLP